MNTYTLIVPCYNEESNIEIFFNTAYSAFKNANRKCDIIFIDDGSKDNTYNELLKIYDNNRDCVSVVHFSRNFGKEAAMLAGLQHAKGEYISIIDADLQQSPETVLEMIEVLDSHPEYDMVAAYQEKRIEGRLMSFVKNKFYKIINKTSETEFYPGASDFRTFRRNVLDAILKMPEYFRFSKGIFSWIGFNVYYMPYIVQPRNAGETKWSPIKLIKYAIQGFVSFTTFPLKIATVLGSAISIMAIVYMLFVIVQKIWLGISIPGYATLIVLILLLGGVQLMILGIIGEYLAKTYIQGKNRPIYIEKEVYLADEYNR